MSLSKKREVNKIRDRGYPSPADDGIAAAREDAITNTKRDIQKMRKAKVLINAAKRLLEKCQTHQSGLFAEVLHAPDLIEEDINNLKS